jgi:hypothetical protein
MSRPQHRPPRERLGWRLAAMHALMSVGVIAGAAGMLVYPSAAVPALALAYLSAAAFAFAAGLGE